MTIDDFAQHFTRQALRPFQPRPGSMGLEPMLEVYTPGAIVVFILALDSFNDGPTRHSYLRALGLKCAQEYPAVEALRFGSEAWLRSFTPEETTARGNRLIEDYPDKEEGIIVFGQLADSSMLLAQAKLYRRPNGKIERLGEWKVTLPQEGTHLKTPLLEAFWEGYRQGKAASN